MNQIVIKIDQLQPPPYTGLSSSYVSARIAVEHAEPFDDIRWVWPDGTYSESYIICYDHGEKAYYPIYPVQFSGRPPKTIEDAMAKFPFLSSSSMGEVNNMFGYVVSKYYVNPNWNHR